MKPPNYRRPVIDTLGDIDSASDFATDFPIDFPTNFPPSHGRVARYTPPRSFVGSDFRNDTITGLSTTDVVDYSELREGTSIVANLATGRIDKIFTGAAIGLGGKEARFIRIYQPYLSVDVKYANDDMPRMAELGVLSWGVFISGTRRYGYDDVARMSGSVDAPSRAIRPYVELDLGRSFSIDSIVLRAPAGAPLASSLLRVYVSNQPTPSSTSAYDTLAADPTVAWASVDVNAITTFTDTLSRIQNLVGTSRGDRLTGDGNANTLSGGYGNDKLTGGAGADNLNGDEGNDTIVQDMSLFADVLIGGDGVDTVDYSSGGTAGSIVANLAAGTVAKRVGASTFTDTLGGIENVIGTELNDSITGDAGANDLSGGSGDDILTGGAGADSLYGGGGNDWIVQDMSLFADMLFGGFGTNTADYSSGGTTGSILANLADSTVVKRVGASTFTDQLWNIQDVVGTALADNITGNRLVNRLSGGADNDILNGGEGDDILSGGAGADNVSGGDGNDVFLQDIGRSSDILAGGNDNDTADYSLTNLTGIASTGITANLATGKIVKSFAGTSASVGAVGRYIRIYHTDATQLLTLTGLKVFSGGVDVAADKPSGVGADGGGIGGGSIGGGSYNNPWALTDTAVGGAWNGGTRPSTSNLANVTGNKPYIELDLGSLRAIDSVALWGHTNVPGNSNNLRVYVSNKSFAELTASSPKTAYADLAANAGVARVDVAVVDTATTTTFTDTLSSIEKLVGTALNDSLTGDSNTNTLSGGAGNDTLDGGVGNDALAGGVGSDTYLFGRGSGTDLIQENDAMAGNKDVLRFGSTIDASQVWLRKVNSDLELSLIGTSDRVIVEGWYTRPSAHVEEIYAGGKKLLDTNVDKLVSAMAAFNLPAAGQTSLPTNLQTALQPMIAANWTAA